MKSIGDIAAAAIGLAVVVMAVVGIYQYLAETTARDWNDFFSTIGFVTVLVAVLAVVCRVFGVPLK